MNMRVMIDREGEHLASVAAKQVMAQNMSPEAYEAWMRQQNMGASNGATAYNRWIAAGMRNAIPPSPQQLRFRAAQAIAEAARERRLTACETCECAACVTARKLPAVLRILAAAERRKS